jgi:hypothetical protein
MGIVVNGLVTVVAQSLLDELAAQAPWEWYRDAGVAVAGLSPRAFGAFMVIFEVSIGVAILNRNRVVRMAGFLTAAAFLIGITPLGVYTLVNPLLAAGCVYLAWREWHSPAPRRADASRAFDRTGSWSCPQLDVAVGDQALTVVPTMQTRDRAFAGADQKRHARTDAECRDDQAPQAAAPQVVVAQQLAPRQVRLKVPEGELEGDRGAGPARTDCGGIPRAGAGPTPVE